MKINIKILAVCIAIPLAVGILAGLITAGCREVYQGLVKPPLTPPVWVFPVVWTILYVLMGVASYLIVMSPLSAARTKALRVYAVQLAVNFFWPVFFFYAGWYLFAFIWLLLLWYLVYICIIRFYGISKQAAYLMAPYIVWLTFAEYLNLFVVVLN